MAQVRKRNGKWCIDYRAYGKRYRECIGPNKKLAQEVLHKRMTEIAEGKFLDKKKQYTIKFEDFAREYIELYSKSHKKSWEKDLTRLKPLIKFFGGKCFAAITPLMVQEYISLRKKGELRISKETISTSTINRELACLKHMFTMAIQWGKAEVNPVKKVKLFKENNQRVRYLEREEAGRLVECCQGHTRRVVIIALNTGMRRSELLKLKWSDIDFRRDIIYLHDTKNGEKRELPMNDAVKQAFIKQPKHKDSDYIFCGRNGVPFKDIKKSFLAALRKTGIINFRFHDLRHTFASWLAMSGVDLNTIRVLIGHKSIRMTQRYAHLSPAHNKRAVDVLAQKWSLDGHKAPSEVMTENSDLEKSLKINAFHEMAR